MHGQRPTECTTKRRYSSGAPLRKPPAEEWRWPTVSTFFLAVNAWFSQATSATVPPLQSGLGTFDLGSVLCILPYAPPSDLHFRLKIKSCTRKRKKKAKRKKRKKKKKAADVSRRAQSECLFSVLFLFLVVAARGVHEGGYVEGRVISYR